MNTANPPIPNRDGIQKPFGMWAKSIQSRLEFEYECSGNVLDQGVILGTIREAVVQRILREFLPPSLEIGTGQIVDLPGTLSNQIDIVIARNQTPIFRYPGGISVFLLETVLATVEVKSMLYGEKLAEALDNCRSVKDLRFGIHTRGKGATVFNEAFEWVQNNGGLNLVEARILQPAVESPLACPEDVWSVMSFVRFWMHWEAGDFRTPVFLQQMTDILDTPDFDVFSHLLCDILGEREPATVLSERFSKAASIKTVFFKRIYEILLQEQLPPNTFILAYGGYEKLENLMEGVKNWYGQNRQHTTWSDLPRVIMNHKMFMYRHYNEYYCAAFDCPSLFFMAGICTAITRQLSFPVGIGAVSQITRYFHLGKILGAKHPMLSGNTLIWSIPFDGSSEGEIIAAKR